MTDSEDESETEMDGRCYVGNWMADGLHGMYVTLTSDTFCEDEMEDFLEEQEEAGGTLQIENEFLKIPMDPDHGVDEWDRIHVTFLRARELVVASGVMRLWAQDSCPPMIRIQKIHPKEMEQLLEKKKRGNEEFAKKNFSRAIEYYDEALLPLDDLYVAPAEHMELVVNILSNMAECYLRLKQYEDAGNFATKALLFNDSHEKSRLRRAKVEMAKADVFMLVQAQVDLEQIVKNRHSSAGVKQAKQYLKELEDMLAVEKRTFETKNPYEDWDDYVEMLEETMW